MQDGTANTSRTLPNFWISLKHREVRPKRPNKIRAHFLSQFGFVPAHDFGHSMMSSRRSDRPPPLRKRSISVTGLQKEGRTEIKEEEVSPSPPREKSQYALFDTASVVCLEIEALLHGDRVPLWFYVPETSQMTVSQLEDVVRDHLRYASPSQASYN